MEGRRREKGWEGRREGGRNKGREQRKNLGRREKEFEIPSLRLELKTDSWELRLPMGARAAALAFLSSL